MEDYVEVPASEANEYFRLGLQLAKLMFGYQKYQDLRASFLKIILGNCVYP